jgi:DNA-binding transcriptional LysR family regulator
VNLRQIEVFHAVYSAGSISAASRVLNVSQPSVSKVVKHTESGLGFPLFRLVKGRLVATDEAHVLFRDVHDLHERIGVFQQAARNLRSCAEGKIRIGLLPSLALSVVPEAVSRFSMIAPRAGFEIISVHHDSFRQTLSSRECDLVVGHHLLQGPEVHSVSLGTGCVGVLFRRGLLPDSVEHVQLSALDGHDLISLTPSVAIANLLGGAMDLRGRDSRRTIAVNSVFVGAALARQGLGIAVVDEFTARGIMDADLCFRPIRPAVTFDLKALHLAEQPLSRLTRSFLDVMRRIVSRPMVEPMDAVPYPQAIATANH